MKIIRKILFPFSLLYYLVTLTRNVLYNTNILKSKRFEMPVICVGNLSVGGTGKSPMIEYLVTLLKDKMPLGVLSRGYKRVSKGFLEVMPQHTAKDVGDEPLQFKRKFPDVTIAVDANRCRGIETIKNKVDVVLLDDAFQHRKVSPSFSILLTSFNQLYVDDCLLPAGNLRESKSGAKRAQVVVVTKCPENLSLDKQQKIAKKLSLADHQHLFFTKIAYASQLKNETTSLDLSKLSNQSFCLVTGIANPAPLVDFLKNKGFTFSHKAFGDHHHFSNEEVALLKKEKMIITTEKDFVRLKDPLKHKALFYLPITTQFINNSAPFDALITKAVSK